MNVKKVKKDFAIILFVLISVLVIIGFILVLSIMKSVSYQQLQTAGESIAVQATDSFEFAIMQIWEQINTTVIYDNELTLLAQERYQNSVSAQEVYSRLRNIKLGSPYITAVYLYSQKEDRFLDADKGCSYLSEDFLDPAIHDTASSRYITSVPPHLVRFSHGEETVLCYTLVVPLLHYAAQTGFSLCIQIDLDKLYADILGDKQSNGMELYLCSKDGIVLAAQDRSVLGEKLAELEEKLTEPSPLDLILGRKGMMWAKTWSEELNWYFYMQMPYEVKIPDIFNTYAILWGILLAASVIIVIAYILLNFLMRPFHEAVLELNEKHLKELLTDSFSNPDTLEKMGSFNEIFPCPCLQIIVMDSLHNLEDFSRSSLSVIEALKDRYSLKIFPMSMAGNRIALICNYDQKIWTTDTENAFLRQLLTDMDCLYPGEAYLALSLQKTNVSQLPLAYKECEEIQNYKLYMKNRILHYKELAGKRLTLSYPTELEKQLINNLLVGNQEGCALYTEKFITYLLDNEAIFLDNQIANAIFQMQNEILRRISSLPLSVNTVSLATLPEKPTRNEVRDFVEEFICYLSDKIVKKNEKNESLLNQSILEYIDAHFVDESFNLNQISYQFNLNRNYLAKLIKEETGQSFNEYINQRKIAVAKDLLLSTKLSIEEIAHQTGFSYSHYFIKIFKSREGITPGQYRDTYSGNTNAPE